MSKKSILNKLNIPAPQWGTAYSIEEALSIAEKIKYGLQPGSGNLNSIIDDITLPFLISGIVIKFP